ncbi:Chemotaxis protein methyltransferase [Roseomonas sp. CECT 9278]|nr:Chemotaxis protein methyltransferase [Roseomonas sp. CECT 9278]
MQAGLPDLAIAEPEFRRICETVRNAAGIVLGPGKRDMVVGRLRRRLRAHGLTDFADYLALVDGPSGKAERVEMINAITTNLTHFFREKHHFDHLGSVVLRTLPPSQKRLRIWSAGCSSGEEPYSIAMVLLDALGEAATLDMRVLATDIDTAMVRRGAEGRYDAARADDVPAPLRMRHTRRLTDGTIEMLPALRDVISFLPLNLLDPWPMRGPFDVIFCRNVMIYFDKDTQRALVDRFADMLQPNGTLYVGHSETLHRTSQRFQHMGETIYRRIA